ncbi:MAG: flagellin [Luminiphilus sp.]|nr:flagellin [Luminiphilus sp.]
MISLGNLTEGASRALSALVKTQRGIDQSMERLSSGARVNSAADDAAGMAIASRMQAHIMGIQQGIENGLDGINLIQTADAALDSLVKLNQRIRELYVQQMNGTQGVAEQAILQSEIDQLRVTLTDLARQSEFNAQPLFMTDREAPFIVGADTTDLISVSLPRLVDTIETPVSFKNGDFEVDVPDSNSITGWDIVERVIIFGTDSIAGHVTPSDPVAKGTDQNTPSNAGNMVVTTSSAQASVGSQSVRLTSSGITTSGGFDTVRGPALISQDQVTFKVGDSLSFDWRAQGGGDAYDVYAYLLNVSTGETVEMLNDTGAAAGATTNWQSETLTVSKPGTYRFVFVGGTFDASGGKAAGAQLFVDNIVATSTETTFDFALATDSLASVDQAIDTLLSHRAGFGATINRIFHAVDSLTMTSVNLEASKSVIEDADYAAETARLAASSIIHQAASNTLKNTTEASMRVLAELIEATDQR